MFYQGTVETTSSKGAGGEIEREKNECSLTKTQTEAYVGAQVTALLETSEMFSSLAAFSIRLLF